MPHASDDRGQTLVLAGLLLAMLLGFAGIAIDIGWFELNLVRIQRAADAAALAGAVYLPADPLGAFDAAQAEAVKNGYTHGAGGMTVTTERDPNNDRSILVAIQAPVQTFFARMLGVPTIVGSRRARAEFVLPVPMGSPQNYYGISQLCDSSGSCGAVTQAPGGGSPLASQGFWGAVITKGGQHSHGDAYSPVYDGGTNPNLEHDASGYGYTVEFPPGTTRGEVWLFDAAFCAVGHGPAFYLGTGDHWIGAGGTPVTTHYRLWDTRGTPYTLADDVLVADSGTTFFNQNQVDKGPLFGGDGQYADGAGYTGGSSADCRSDRYHNGWYSLADNVPAGSYRLQVTTSDPSNNATSAENMFGIEVLSNVPGARVYGESRMAAYTNVTAGSSLFYLARVEAVHAGKTLEIKLFDAGDVTGSAYLRIKRPTSTGYVDATFNFSATAGIGPRSGANVTQLQTADAGTVLYNNAWITIEIPLPANYGQGGLTPPGETEPGWWKIEYQVTAAGNDTTTWKVNVRGNPVHLTVP